jgi:methionyl-tRNA formyltransferase
MRMEAGLDTGPVLREAAVEIGPQETAGSLHDRLSALGAELIVPALEAVAAGEAPLAQPGTGATYAAKVEKAEAEVDWTRPAVEVDRLIRGLSPAPGAWTEMRGERVRLLLSRAEPTTGEAAPGTVLDDRLLVACGEGAVRLLRLQRAGRAAQEAEAFLRGFGGLEGARLGRGG